MLPTATVSFAMFVMVVFRFQQNSNAAIYVEWTTVKDAQLNLKLQWPFLKLRRCSRRSKHVTMYLRPKCARSLFSRVKLTTRMDLDATHAIEGSRTPSLFTNVCTVTLTFVSSVEIEVPPKTMLQWLLEDSRIKIYQLPTMHSRENVFNCQYCNFCTLLDSSHCRALIF